MEIKEFIANIAEQFDAVENVDLSGDTRFRELEGYTSLVALMIITMIDEEYGVVLSGDDMKKIVTIQELFDLVNSKL